MGGGGVQNVGGSLLNAIGGEKCEKMQNTNDTNQYMYILVE